MVRIYGLSRHSAHEIENFIKVVDFEGTNEIDDCDVTLFEHVRAYYAFGMLKLTDGTNEIEIDSLDFEKLVIN